MENLNIGGLAIGLSTFLIIGVFHPLVIKGEYYFGTKVNYAFFAGGVAAFIAALLMQELIWSALLAIVAFSCFWSILEVNHQVRRVEKGWFPMNPKRKHEYNIRNSAKKDEKRLVRFTTDKPHINN